MSTATCKRGHPWTPESTRMSGGFRSCRICARERSAARLARLQGEACRGCGRTGVYVDTGVHCARCRKRLRRGVPLDAPPIRTAKASAPPVETPRRPPEGSKLPKGWYDPPKNQGKQKTRQTSSLVKDVLDVGPIPETPPELVALCSRLLVRHAATDLADMLGLPAMAAEEPPAPACEPADTEPVPDAAGPAAVVYTAVEGRRAEFLAEVAALVESGMSGDQIAAQVGYAHASSLCRRLDTLGRHDLARRLRPPQRNRRKKAVA